MMKFILTPFIFLFLFSNYSFGQHKEAYEGISELDEKFVSEQNYLQLHEELEGTFQLKYNVIGMKPLIEKSTLAKASNERLQSQDVYVQLSENVKLFLPSYDAINAANFVPLETEKYIGTGNSAYENQ